MVLKVVVRPRPGSVVDLDLEEHTVSIVASKKDEPTTKEVSTDGKQATPLLKNRAKEAPSRTYSVSTVLPMSTSQHDLYDQVVKRHVVDAWLDKGEHGAVFAYGFTGTGKSYSLFGTTSNPGMVVLTARQVLERLHGMDSEAMLRVSMFEVDGKQIKDLLAADDDDDSRLTVRTDEQGCIHLRRAKNAGPLTRRIIHTTEQFQEIYQAAQASRRVGSSTVHDASSRTHAIVDMELVHPRLLQLEEEMEQCHADYIRISNDKDDILKQKLAQVYKERDGDLENAMIDGVPMAEVMAELGRPSEEALEALHRARLALAQCRTQELAADAYRGSFSFIDMAGNDWEKAWTQQTKQAKVEHSHINSSLLAVKECFRAMSSSSTHVPYRRSVLTHVLQRHFASPTSSCVMLTTIYPHDQDAMTHKQTMNTLMYASSISRA